MALFVRRPSMTKKEEEQSRARGVHNYSSLHRSHGFSSIDRSNQRAASFQSNYKASTVCAATLLFIFIFIFFLSFLSFCFRVVVVSVLYRCCPFERHARHRTRLLIRKWSPSIPPQSSPTFHNDQVTMWDVTMWVSERREMRIVPLFIY